MSLTSQIRYVRVLDSTATDGSGKTGIAFGSFTAKYNVMGGTLTSLTTEDITTLGTYQAPTSAAHIRIKELSASDPCKGVYEVHFHNTQLVNTGKRLWLYLSAAGAASQPLEVDLIPYMDLDAQSADDIKDFADAGYDPATNKVQGVVLTDTVTTYTGNTPQTGDVYALVDTEIAAILTAVDTEIAAILVDTNELQVDWTNGGRLDLLIDAILADSNELQTDWADGGRLDLILDARASQTSVNTIDDFLDTEVAAILAAVDTEIGSLITSVGALFTTAMTEAYSTDGATATPAQALYLIMQMLHELSFSGTTGTVKKLDGSTTAYTLTINSATTPTSITRAT